MQRRRHLHIQDAVFNMSCIQMHNSVHSLHWSLFKLSANVAFSLGPDLRQRPFIKIGSMPVLLPAPKVCAEEPECHFPPGFLQSELLPHAHVEPIWTFSHRSLATLEMRLAERRNMTSKQIEAGAGAGGRESTQGAIRITPIRHYNPAVFYVLTVSLNKIIIDLVTNKLYWNI